MHFGIIEHQFELSVSRTKAVGDDLAYTAGKLKGNSTCPYLEKVQGSCPDPHFRKSEEKYYMFVYRTREVQMD